MILTRAEARRVALAAQGFARKRPQQQTARSVAATIATTELLQIDSVNVLVRAHYMPLFSRLGGYDRALLDEAAWGKKRSLFEYWVHEASLVPLELHPVLRWRMDRARDGVGIYRRLARFAQERKSLINEVLHRIRHDGPLGAGAFDTPRAGGGWWGWSDAKLALEYLFWSGQVTTATRRNFERLYDLPERVIPDATLALPTPTLEEAHRELVRRATRALGIATRRDIRDYFRTTPGDTDPRIAELVEAGELSAVEVEGVRQTHYMPRGTSLPKRIEASALLCPFDPVVWQRARAEELFEFHYRIEIYTPAAKRKHGYYVLPFLYNERLAARVDLKTDRKTGTLRVLATHGETHAGEPESHALAAELRILAAWLGTPRISVSAKGRYAKQLRAAMK